MKLTPELITGLVSAMRDDERRTLVNRLVDEMTSKERRLLARRLAADAPPGPEEQWWRDRLVEGQLLPDREGWPTEVNVATLANVFADATGRGEAALTKLLERVCPAAEEGEREFTVGGRPQRVRCYRLPSLEEARAAWEAIYGEAPWA